MDLNVIIEKDESGYFVAEVPGMPGCYSQGKTVDAVKANIKEAIQGWLEVMNEKARNSKKYDIFKVSV